VEQVNFSEFVQAVSDNKVESVSIQEDVYSGKFKPDYKNGASFETVGLINSDKAFEILKGSDAKVEYKKRKDTPFWQQILISWLPMLLLFAFFFFSMRQIQVGGGKAMSFGRSKARLLWKIRRGSPFRMWRV
jgi:cell division protease FtsH